MSLAGNDALDNYLYEATKSTNVTVDAEAVARFCDAVNRDIDGASTAARLLGHKIQSPQERESLNALSVTDECIKKCGRRFQDEVGKFRFLNEMIKMISPKYFGDKTSKKVKEKCIELLYRWSVELRHEPKILDAYEMLKRQGIIDDDPIIGDGPTVEPVSTSSAVAAALNVVKAEPAEASAKELPSKAHPMSIFNDNEKSLLLAKLLKSRNPEDLQAANRLIKNMVKSDEEKQEKISQRYHLLETIRNNVKLVNEMLDCYQMAGGSSSSDLDVIKELHQNIENEKPKLLRMASETEEKDSEGMSKILQVNDEVVQVIARYKHILESSVGGKPNLLDMGLADARSGTNAEHRLGSEKTTALSSDLAGLDILTGGAASDNLFTNFTPAPVSSYKTGESRPNRTTNQTVYTSHDLYTSFSSAPIPMAATASAFRSSDNSPFTNMATASNSAFGAFSAAGTAAVPLAGVNNNAFGRPATSNNVLPFSTSSQSTSMPSNSSTASTDLREIFQSALLPRTDPKVFPNGSNQMHNASLAQSLTHNASLTRQPMSDIDSALLSLDDTSSALAPPLLPSNKVDTTPLFDVSENQFDTKKSALEDLDVLGKSLLQQTKATQNVMMQPISAPTVKPTLNQLKASSTDVPGSTNVNTALLAEVQPLTNVFVPLETVQPSSHPSLVALEKDGVKIVLHFASNMPRPDITVMVVSIMSMRTEPIKTVMFQAAVPKSMKVKLQPPSATELPTFNPILPPTAISQVLLLANPNKDKIKLKYKLTYHTAGNAVTETGDVVNFPW